MATTQQAVASVGDRVEVSGRRVGDGTRSGEILEVLGESSRPHYRVRWEDGHESILYPGEATTIVPRVTGVEPKPQPALDVAAATHELVDVLAGAHISFELLPHRRTTTAAGEARVLGVLPQQVAKTLVLRGHDGGRVRAVVPAATKLDKEKLERAVGAEMTLLTENELIAAYPQFEVGAVPPFGGEAGDRVVVDEGLVAIDHVVLEAGVHDTSLRLRSEDLVAVAGATVADIALGA